MQTFHPYRSIRKSVECLIYEHSRKQRVEALQILRALAGLTKGWRHHPATKRWRGYEPFLIEYGMRAAEAWVELGRKRKSGKPYKDTCRDKIAAFKALYPGTPTAPPWLTEEFCLSHQSNLIRKYPEHYRPLFGPDVPDDLPYVWPV